ncbi:hypothetical protein [Chamaesiphon polymorphus]|uniref:Uncharacterized protein n=1 Tax=Chamaesiphon polymorphus CCALA 037 TaxID=2107692 RepID=A0A2T1G6F7_9CYAN|nr:hypothetical protein [Chamaesiphon polymorphus]PSB52822.1 hypothetical protein C7B77_20100 [Chamaesiphon polymorphus CCALA 037]
MSVKRYSRARKSDTTHSALDRANPELNRSLSQNIDYIVAAVIILTNRSRRSAEDLLSLLDRAKFL